MAENSTLCRLPLFPVVVQPASTPARGRRNGLFRARGLCERQPGRDPTFIEGHRLAASILAGSGYSMMGYETTSFHVVYDVYGIRKRSTALID